MKIIGCGNPDRGDDQAGLLVVERLRQSGVKAETHTGDPLLLLEKWRKQDRTILVDAILTGAAPGSIRVWDRSLPLSLDSAPVSSHGFDIAKAIELARSLDSLPTHFRVYGIEGRQFAPGASLSPEVERAIHSVVRQISADIQAWEK